MALGLKDTVVEDAVFQTQLRGRKHKHEVQLLVVKVRPVTRRLLGVARAVPSLAFSRSTMRRRSLRPRAPQRSVLRSGEARAVHRLMRGILRETARMAYDLELADRIRAIVQAEPGLTEKRMFGGLAFLIEGHMAVSASSQGGLLLRVDPAKSESLINEPHVRRFEMRGRQMAGWLRVDPEAVAADDDLQRWVSHGVTYARSLPAK
jgi:hypothetical protein